MELFKAFATIALDISQFEEKVKKAKGTFEGLGKSISKSVGNITKVIGKGLVVGATAGATAIGALTKSAVDSFAEYEQLVGGVETLFKESANVVQEYAAEAYKTAGLSANQYMETVTSFSASLLQSLGGDTAKASEYANQAIIDMSDNANKMGTSMEMIQNAYQGFAKQNYTMLDNLKLGYGGTKTEMERLLQDADKLSESFNLAKDINGDLVYSYADVVDAIHIVQNNMGITGTTAKEASQTISGSVSAMKSAWSNLVAGMADDNADIQTLMDKFVESISTVGVNILPVVKTALEGAAKLVSTLAPVIASQLPTLMEQILPPLATATAGLIVALAEQIPSMTSTLIDAAYQVVDEIGNAFAERIPALSWMFENLETVVIALTAAFVVYKSAVAISGIINTLVKATKGQTVAQTLLNAVMSANPFALVAALVVGLTTAIITLWNTNEDFRNALIKAWEFIKEKAIVIFSTIANFFTETIPNAFNNILNWFSNIGQKFAEIGMNIVSGLKQGISNAWGGLKKWFTGLWDGLVSGVKDFLGIHSPSRVFASIGQFMLEGLEIGMMNTAGEVMETISDIVDEVKNRFSDLSGLFGARQDVGQLKYELWERTYGQAASDEERYRKQLELLNSQQQEQQNIVEAAANAYNAIVEQYGAGSVESLQYQKVLLQEQLAYQDLLDEINKVIEAQEELEKLKSDDWINNVSFEKSSIAKVAQAHINAIVDEKQRQNINLEATLKMPDGSTLARYYLPSFINEAKSNGTPILNPI